MARKITRRDIDYIFEKKAQGKTYEETARELGVCEAQTLHYHLKKDPRWKKFYKCPREDVREKFLKKIPAVRANLKKGWSLTLAISMEGFTFKKDLKDLALQDEVIAKIHAERKAVNMVKNRGPQ